MMISSGCLDNWSPSTSPAKSPAVTTSVSEFDFGFVEPYTILPYPFYAHSTGTLPLTFYSASGSSWSRLGETPGNGNILPGDSLQLVCWYRSRDYNATGYRPITVYFNDGDLSIVFNLAGYLLEYFEHPLETDSLRREFPFTGSSDELTSLVPFYNTTEDTAWITPVLLPDSRVDVSFPEFIPPQETSWVEIDVNGRPVGSSYYQATTFDVQTSYSSRYTIGIYRAGK